MSECIDRILKAPKHEELYISDNKMFLASFFWKKLQAFLENVASPFWRKLQPHGVAGATPWKQTFFVKSY